MSEDQFTKLFKYVQQIDEKVNRIEENMVTKTDYNHLLNIMDNYATHLDT